MLKVLNIVLNPSHTQTKKELNIEGLLFFILFKSFNIISQRRPSFWFCKHSSYCFCKFSTFG